EPGFDPYIVADRASAERLGLAATARLTDDILQNSVNRLRLRAALETRILRKGSHVDGNREVV
ncbi:MAG TPA: hypothetical protein VIU42_09740, partial [Xanthobacteraceae bacterium]